MNDQKTILHKPEWELICRLCRQAITGTAKPGDEGTADSNINWNTFLSAAKHHRLPPLLSEALEDGEGKSLPQQVRQNIIRDTAITTVRDARFQRETSNITNALRTAGVPYSLIKGPALGIQAYGGSHLRFYDDLDILVQPEMFMVARDTLIQSGYVPQLDVSEREAIAQMRAGWDCYLSKPEKSGFIELTAGIAPRYQFPILEEEFWARTTEIDLGGCTVTTFAPEPTLVLLCVHGAKHTWSRLRWLTDAAGLIERTPDMDWDTVQSIAARYGAKRMLALGLHLVSTTFDIPLPEQARALTVNDPQVPRLAKQAMTTWILAEGYKGATEHEDLVFYFKARERLRDRVAMLWLMALAPSYGDWRWIRLPDWLSPLYYLVRPIRLIVRAMRRG